MKLNNKGFAISTIMYMIMILAVLLITLTLALLSGRKLILDKLKVEVQNNIYNKYDLTYRETLNILKEEVIEHADSNGINKESIKISDLNLGIDSEILDGYNLSNKYLTVNYNNGTYDTYLGQEKTITDISKPVENMLDIVDYKIEGNTYQKTYTGKNLFDISKVKTNTERSVVNNQDGTLTINRSETSIGVSSGKLSDYANLEVGKTYILTANSTDSKKYIYLGSISSWKFGTARTITQEDLNSEVFWYSSEMDVPSIISNIQIEEGTKATEYEPYVGGKTSPNPEYPSEIKSVGDGKTYSLEIEHSFMQSGYYQIKINNKLLPTGELFSISFDKEFAEFGIKYEFEDGTTGSLPIGYSNSRYYFKAQNNKILAGNSNRLGWERTLEKTIKNFYIYAYGKVENGWDTKPNITLESGYKVPITVSGKNLFDYQTIYNKLLNSDYILSNGYYVISIDNLKPNTKYYVKSYNYLDIDQLFVIGGTHQVNNGKNGAIKCGTISNLQNQGIIITDNEGKMYIGCPNINIFKDYISQLQVQIEIGEVETSYEPYVNELTTNIYLDEPLRNIDSNIDSIVYKEQKLIKNTNSLKLTGSENYWSRWKESATDKTLGVLYFNDDVLGVYQNPKFKTLIGFSNYFKVDTKSVHTQNDDSVGSALLSATASPPYFGFKVPYTNLSDWLTYLQEINLEGNPLKVEYVLNETENISTTLPHIDTSVGSSRISIDTEIEPSKVEFTIIEKIKQL